MKATSNKEKLESAKQKSNLNTSPIVPRPASAFPIRKHNDIDNPLVGVNHIRIRENPNHNLSFQNRHHWDITSKGIKRDLLLITQDEIMDTYKFKQKAKEIHKIRPLSAVEVLERRHSNPNLKSLKIREKIPPKCNSNIRNDELKWNTQTYDDITDDRARPMRNSSYRSHEAFANLLAEINLSK